MDLALPPPAEGTKEIKARVDAARTIQAERYASTLSDTKRPLNADASAKELETYATPGKAGAELLSEAAQKLQLTARSYMRVLKVARTIADLDGSEAIARLHIAEALTYRRRPPGSGAAHTATETGKTLVY